MGNYKTEHFLTRGYETRAGADLLRNQRRLNIARFANRTRPVFGPTMADSANLKSLPSPKRVTWRLRYYKDGFCAIVDKDPSH